MITAKQFLDACKERGRDFFTGTPCSYLKPLINYTIDSPDFMFVDSVNEGDAIAMAAGAVACGKKPVVMFQNSGLGNAINPLTSLCFPFKIPMLVIVTWRAEPGGKPDEPQHELMGEITPKLIEDMGFSWTKFPKFENEIDLVLERAERMMEETSLPFFLIMSDGDVAKFDLPEQKTEELKRRNPEQIMCYQGGDLVLPRRIEMLDKIGSEYTDCAIVATTGKTGRELYEVGDRKNQIYMVGAMGCALAFGLGVALNTEKKVIVIDGDGALLMRTGSMATVGLYRPSNMYHILLDNEVHDSTGGQKTASPVVDWESLAKAFGYDEVRSSFSLYEPKEVIDGIDEMDGPYFGHVKIAPGSKEDLGRPKVTPREVFDRFQKFLTDAK